MLPQVLKKVKYGSLDDLYAAIGYRHTTAQKAVIRVRDEILRLNKLQKEQAAQQEMLERGEGLHVASNPAVPIPSPRAPAPKTASLWKDWTTAWSSLPSAARRCLEIR